MPQWYELDDEEDDEPTVADRLKAHHVTRQTAGPGPIKGVIDAVRTDVAENVPADELRQPDDRVANLVADTARQHIEAYQTQAQASNLPPLQGNIDELTRQVVDEILGLGPLQALMDEPGIEDIAINGPHEVFVFKNGTWSQSSVAFGGAEELTVLINRAISHTGRQVSARSPRVDAQLRDGSRVNILHPSIANPGPSVTIRRYSDQVMRMLDLVRSGSGKVYAPRPPAQFTDYFGLGIWDGTITPQAATFLEMCVLARMNVIVVGGTGAGKTTLLNALAELIPDDQRIVTIEDTRELRIRQRDGAPNNVVNLTVRYETLEGMAGVNQQQLLQNALRMRPDRLIIGEVRGAEALDLLMAHNTGHDGGLTTIHANSLVEVAKRLGQMIQLNDLSIKIDRRTVAEWVAGAFQIGVFINRDPATNRRAVTQVVEYTGQVEGDAVLTQKLFDFKDGQLQRTPFRLQQEHLLARIGHNYDTVMELDKLAPWNRSYRN